jgi:glycosyltransferase involved in cell wall biosynthesis
MLNLSSILRSIGFFGNALITKNWIDNYIKNNNIDLSNTIFYTYWLDEITLGICLAKQKYPKIKIISRAHGADLYEERHLPPYIPYRPEIFNLLDRVFTDSQAGRTYLITRYPLHKSLFEISCLGVSKQDFITEPSNDSIFRIVSCSNLVPIKRIDLLIRGLVELGMLRPHQIFDWVHIGGGPLRLELEQAARILLPQNIKYHFLGYLPKGGVISFYQNNKVDVFINVSSSEGTPVSVMEAQSCSIPVIATAVGGNSEIVTSDNGLLLTENPKADEIANAICFLLKDRNLIQDKKKKSYENWDKNYNSEKNLPSFATDLINILKNNKNRREKET